MSKDLEVYKIQKDETHVFCKNTEQALDILQNEIASVEEELIDMSVGEKTTIIIEKCTMSKAEIDNLPDFNGF